MNKIFSLGTCVSTSKLPIPVRVMGSDGKFELSSANVAPAAASEGNGKAAADEVSLSVKQTRIRRLFTETQLFAFSAWYLTTWLGVGSSMYCAFLNGCPVAYLFNYIIVLLGVLTQAASLGELAFVQPVAGAQYVN